MDKVPEISIYGDPAPWLVNEGIKLLTLRLDQPKYANLKVGRIVFIRFDHDFCLGEVFSRQVKPLRTYTPAELLLDGYLSVSEAVEDMKHYPGYENVTPDTPMLGIGLTTSGRLYAYLGELKRQLLFSTPLEEAIKMPVFHDLFLPSYLWWAILQNEQSKTILTINKWHHLLCNHLNIFDSDSLQRVRQVDEQTKKFYAGLRHRTIRDILKYDSTASPEYKSVVLCQPVSVNK